jgi:hypothetical protein
VSRRKVRRPQVNPVSDDTVIYIGLGAGLLAVVAYGIYVVSEAKDTLAETNEQIGQATQTAQGISAQIPGVQETAGNVAGAIQGATQTVQSAQASPAAQAAQGAASWWNNLWS